MVQKIDKDSDGRINKAGNKTLKIIEITQIIKFDSNFKSSSS
jgi:hypothetical protein